MLGEQISMKLSKRQRDFCSLRLSTREWQEIGKKAGWTYRPEQAEATTIGEGMSNATSTATAATTEIDVDGRSDRTGGMEIEVVLSCEGIAS